MSALGLKKGGKNACCFYSGLHAWRAARAGHEFLPRLPPQPNVNSVSALEIIFMLAPHLHAGSTASSCTASCWGRAWTLQISASAEARTYVCTGSDLHVGSTVSHCELLEQGIDFAQIATAKGEPIAIPCFLPWLYNIWCITARVLSVRTAQGNFFCPYCPGQNTIDTLHLSYSPAMSKAGCQRTAHPSA